MLPILDAAELLGLVKSQKGDITLTEFGFKFQKTTRDKVRLLTDHLARIEPFKTSVELAQKYGEVTTSQVARSLSERDKLAPRPGTERVTVEDAPDTLGHLRRPSHLQQERELRASQTIGANTTLDPSVFGASKSWGNALLPVQRPRQERHRAVPLPELEVLVDVSRVVDVERHVL